MTSIIILDAYNSESIVFCICSRRHRLLKGMRGGGSPPPGFCAIGGGVGAFRVGAGRDGIKGGAVKSKMGSSNFFAKYRQQSRMQITINLNMASQTKVTYKKLTSQKLASPYSHTHIITKAI